MRVRREGHSKSEYATNSALGLGTEIWYLASVGYFKLWLMLETKG